jgi:hypothetical protein
MTFHIFGIVAPTDELIFFRGVGIPPTRLLSFLGFVGLWDAYISTFLYVGFTHFFIFNTGDGWKHVLFVQGWLKHCAWIYSLDI